MSSNNPFAATPPGSPLTADHLLRINQMLQNVQFAQQQIDLATAAGIDVSARQSQLNDSRDQLMKLKQVYFPGQ